MITTLKPKTLLITLLLTLLIALAIIVVLNKTPTPPTIHGTYLKKPLAIKSFKLITQDDTEFSKQTLEGRWTLVFFGFTHCAVVCPTTMAVLNDLYKQLELELSKDLLPQIVLISVDPSRDTSQRLKEFVHAFNPHFIGARADMKEIIALEKQLYLPTALDNPMNHSTKIILFNPKAQVQAYFSSPHKASQLAVDYKLSVKK